jgi:erythromycin esterase-like protein
VRPPLPGSHELYLMTAGASNYYLDLRPTLNDDALRAWFSQKMWLRSIGWMYDPDNPAVTTVPVILPETFDVFIFFENTKAATQR